MTEEEILSKEKKEVTCRTCGYHWFPYKIHPNKCVKCGTKYWDKKRQKLFYQKWLPEYWKGRKQNEKHKNKRIKNSKNTFTENHPKVKVNCDFCNSEIEYILSKFNRTKKYHFCNKKCLGKFISKYPNLWFSKERNINVSKANKGRKLSEKSKTLMSISKKSFYNTEEGKKIQRERRAKIILPKKDTSIELKIQNFLKELKIEFFTHQYIKIEHGYQCDIFIPSMNLVIECDGDYWHKYPTGNDIDHIRTSELLEKGFKVLRLWEFEINGMNVDKFKERLYGRK